MTRSVSNGWLISAPDPPRLSATSAYFLRALTFPVSVAAYFCGPQSRFLSTFSRSDAACGLALIQAAQSSWIMRVMLEPLGSRTTPGNGPWVGQRGAGRQRQPLHLVPSVFAESAWVHRLQVRLPARAAAHCSPRASGSWRSARVSWKKSTKKHCGASAGRSKVDV